MISAAGSPMKSSPFCRSSSESFSKSASAVSEPVIETWNPSCAVRRLHELHERNDVVAARDDRHHRRLPVLRDERLVAGGVVALRLSDGWEGLRALAQRPHLRLEGWVVDAVALRAHHDDLARRRLRREALVDQRLRLLRLRIARDIAVGRQRVPKQERDHDERDKQSEEPPRKRPLWMIGTRTRETLGGNHAVSSLLRGGHSAAVGCRNAPPRYTHLRRRRRDYSNTIHELKFQKT